MYISTPHGPREGVQRYQDHIDHHLPSFDPNSATIFYDEQGRDFTVIPPILFRQSSIGQIRLYLISFSTVGDELGYAATNPGYGIYTAYNKQQRQPKINQR